MLDTHTTCEISGSLNTIAYISLPATLLLETCFVYSISSYVLGNCSEDKLTPTWIRTLTVLQSNILKHLTIVSTYLLWHNRSLKPTQYLFIYIRRIKWLHWDPFVEFQLIGIGNNTREICCENEINNQQFM